MRPRLGAQLAEQLKRPRIHRLVIKEGEGTEAALELASEKDIRRRRQIVGKRKVLVDHLDSHGARIDWAVKMNGLAIKADRPLVRPEIAGDDLHKRRLAGAVVTHETDHLS